MYFRKRIWNAHRAVAAVLGMDTPDSRLVADHLCRNRGCVNPAHLDFVTRGENTRRGLTGVHNKLKSHCAKGHLFNAKSTYYQKRGGRSCRVCARMRAQKKERIIKAANAPRIAERVAHYAAKYAEIADLRAEGWSYKRLAAKYGVTVDYLRHVIMDNRVRREPHHELELREWRTV